MFWTIFFGLSFFVIRQGVISLLISKIISLLKMEAEVEIEYDYAPWETRDKILIIKELKTICEGILNDYQEFEKLSHECRKWKSWIPPLRQQIIDLSAKDVEPFDDDAQKALYDLSHQSKELQKVNDNLVNAMKKCKEQREKIDSKYQWTFGKIFDKLLHYEYLHYSPNHASYFLQIFGDSQPS